MERLSIDYESIASALSHPMGLGELGAALLEALGDYYAEVHSDSALLFFQQNGATYLFDHASSIDAPHDDRTVAAWALTPPVCRNGMLATSEASRRPRIKTHRWTEATSSHTCLAGNSGRIPSGKIAPSTADGPRQARSIVHDLATALTAAGDPPMSIDRIPGLLTRRGFTIVCDRSRGSLTPASPRTPAG